jgi:ubiquinone/menaquinone biosynthesis C-methylase UbiE
MIRNTLWFSLAVLALLIGNPHIAAPQLSSRPAEEWQKTLDAAQRVESLRVDEVIAKVGLKPGMVVADLGAGTGLFAVPMGKAVAPGGKVYAVEIDKGYFGMIDAKAKAAGVSNVQTVLGEFSDPKIPNQDVDVGFFHDVLHHVQDRAGYLKNLGRYVKPSGRVVIIDLKADQSPHKGQADLIVSEAQVTEWMKAAGFGKVQNVELYPDKFFLVFSR